MRDKNEKKYQLKNGLKTKQIAIKITSIKLNIKMKWQDFLL
jgi:hypothetical protein